MTTARPAYIQPPAKKETREKKRKEKKRKEKKTVEQHDDADDDYDAPISVSVHQRCCSFVTPAMPISSSCLPVRQLVAIREIAPRVVAAAAATATAAAVTLLCCYAGRGWMAVTEVR